ncbi:MAG: FAD:protein FMN transferase [Anaerolineae bacterium]|nr:FAD:protein FMN transferase [Anaerolineae bacterium]
MIHSFEFRAMNTDILLAAEGERGIEGMQAARVFIDECEQRFSRFLPASEITDLNRSAGEWLPVSGDLMEMFQLALIFHNETGGLFDPAILPDLEQAGYDRSMDEIRAYGAMPQPPASKRTSRPAFREIDIAHADNRIRLPRGMQIDLGGIAKGWSVEKAARLLNAYAAACAVSAGGDMSLIGRPSDGMDWDVLLEDPRDPERMLSQLHVGPGGVASSSVMKRTWRLGGKVRHHLIDPRTGEPAHTDWLSVSVIAPDVITADVYAKAILIGGQAELPHLLNARPELTYIAVDRNGRLSGSPHYRDYIHDYATETSLPFEFAY